VKLLLPPEQPRRKALPTADVAPAYMVLEELIEKLQPEAAFR
jgi:hypothetical protein